MAAITSVMNGNWSSPATWGGVVPAESDDITILASHTVTLDINFTSSGSITNHGTLTISYSILSIGTNASAIAATTAGTFTFGAGSILTGNGSFCLNRGVVNSTSTSSSWARVEGNVSFGKTTGIAENWHWGVDYDVQYVSFTTIAIVLFPSRYYQNVGSFKFKNCTFSGCNTVTFGVRSWTTAATPHSYRNLDFRNCGTITFAGTDPTTTGAERTFDSLSFYSDSLQSIYFWIRGGESFPMTNCIFVNYTGAITTYATPMFYKNCFFATTDSASSAKQLVYDSLAGSTLLDSYVHVHPTVKNSHTIKIDNVIGGVMDIESPDGPNIHLPRTATASPMKTEGVLHIGYGDLSNVVGASTLDWDITNCTRVSPEGSSINGVWLSENGVITPASTGLVVRNCLQVCLGSSPDSYMAGTSSPSLNQAIDFDYCHKWNVADFLMSGVFTNASAGSNNADTNPQFYSPSRGFVPWAQKNTGNSSAGYIDGYAYVLKLNGYDATTMKQEAGAETGVSISDMVDWVREGYTPQNLSLLTAGQGGTYIGAIEPATIMGEEPEEPIAPEEPGTPSESASGIESYLGAPGNQTGAIFDALLELIPPSSLSSDSFSRVIELGAGLIDSKIIADKWDQASKAKIAVEFSHTSDFASFESGISFPIYNFGRSVVPFRNLAGSLSPMPYMRLKISIIEGPVMFSVFVSK